MSLSKSTLNGNGQEATPKPRSSGCRICNDLGWVYASHDSTSLEQCICQPDTLKQQQENIRHSSGMYNLLDRMTFESINPNGREGFVWSKSFQSVLESAKKYSENINGWLLITGAHGTGKTHLAVAIANVCIARGIKVIYEQCPDLLDKLINQGTQELQLALKAPLLILDDLSIYNRTDWAENKIGYLLSKRYTEQLPTIVISHIEINSLSKREFSILQDSKLVNKIHIQQDYNTFKSPTDIEQSNLTNMSFELFNTYGRNATGMQRRTLIEAKAAAKIFAEEPNGWLYLSGATGVGKTHLAVAIFLFRISLGEPVIFKFIPDMLDELRNTFSRQDYTGFHDKISTIKDSQLLILDDLGAQVNTSWSEEKIYQILTHRHDRKYPTVITSRILLDSTINSILPFSPKYLSAIMSRLKDAYVVHERYMDAPDYRNRGE